MPYADERVRSNGAVSGMSSWLWRLNVGEGLPLSLYCGCFAKVRNACKVITNTMLLLVLLVFFSFEMHLHTEYRAKADHILEPSGGKLHIFTFICLPNADSVVPRWLLQRLRQVWQPLSEERKKKWRCFHRFPLFDSNLLESRPTGKEGRHWILSDFNSRWSFNACVCQRLALCFQ